MPDSYSDLKAAVASWIERDDLDDRMDDFIDLAEARFNRVLMVPEREASTVLSAASTVALPADFYGIRAIWLDTDPKVLLEQMSLQELKGRWSANATGCPHNFAIEGGDTLVLGPSPDSAYDIELVYWTRIEALSDAEPVNWLLTSHPDIYLFGTLVEAEMYCANDERVGMWRARLDTAMSELLNAGRRKQQSATPQRIRAPYNV